MAVQQSERQRLIYALANTTFYLETCIKAFIENGLPYGSILEDQADANNALLAIARERS